MDTRMQAAAEEGNISVFYSLIRENHRLLEKIDEHPFAQTPMHVAAAKGQTRFAMEMASLKPSFLRKLNEDGYTPVHLAVLFRHTQLVFALLGDSPDLPCLKGKGGKTPFHLAVETGDLLLLSHFLRVSPKSILDVTARQETALHVAVKNDMLEALKVMVDWLKGAFNGDDYHREKTILNWRDEEGNTLLHIAASKGNLQMLELLLSRGVDASSRNMKGLTAVEMLQNLPEPGYEEIKEMMHKKGATKASVIPRVSCFDRTDQRLKRLAEAGNTDGVFAIVREDPYLLDRIDAVNFIDTPMHVAAAAGHTHFALEMMRMKPSFSRKLNGEGYTPMHLAMRNHRIATVLRLLHEDGDLVRVKARDGISPLHFAAERPHLDLLAEFLAACPNSIQDLTVRKETALHVAAKSDSVEALEVLIGWLDHTNQSNVLNWEDEDGNTVLHIACSRNQTEVAKYLLGPAINPLFVRMFPIVRFTFPFMIRSIKVDLHARNSEGKTAVEILEENGHFHSMQIGAIKQAMSFQNPVIPSGAGDLSGYLRRKKPYLERWAISDYREKSHMTDENRNAILVVTVLLATATYQAVLSPPGGFWQGDPTILNQEGDVIRMVGRSVMSKEKWAVFTALNTLVFALALFKMYRLLPRGPYFAFRLVLPLLMCYSLSLVYISPTSWKLAVVVLIVCSKVVFLKSAVAYFFLYKRKWAVNRLFGKTLSEMSANSSHGEGRSYGKRTSSLSL